DALPICDGRCGACGSTRLLRHAERDTLTMAHVDCDAFYAAIEKRNHPELADRPVLVGGRERGVVAAACYVARLYGCRSAMPMAEALRRCPDAQVVRPDMATYAREGRRIRAMMEDLTPQVEPISIDEAFLDLAGTERLRGSPARNLVRLARQIEQEVGITVSIGLSANKFLAKLASDMDKPRGFTIIGRAEAEAVLRPLPVGRIWGVGQALERRLSGDGLRLIGDLQRQDEAVLVARYGRIGSRLARFSHGQDDRPVSTHRQARSISAETTFAHDLRAPDDLQRMLWPLCEKVGRRLRSGDVAGRTVTLKLKTARFASRTRQLRLPFPTQLADTLYRHGKSLLAHEADGTWFRLIGIGVSDLGPGRDADPPDLAEPGRGRRRVLETALDDLRTRMGSDVVHQGRGLPAGRKSGPRRARTP
ncbi:MAG: DNA polymerase IV, partial [Alphaproteobacteria bacterium]